MSQKYLSEEKKPETVVKFKIADILIQMQSDFKLEQLSDKELSYAKPERFNNFLYQGEGKPDIVIKIDVVDNLPEIPKVKDVFITYHPEDHKETWRLQKTENAYIYRCHLEDKKQVMFINQAFDSISAYLMPKKNKGMAWGFTDILYDFLQVILINYFALNRIGIFVHSIGVKDLDGRGLLFAGKSGAGKSTTARIWHKYSKATVLNDDRVIVRMVNNKFFIYGSPWHGEFSDYLQSHIESALLDKLFFIDHAPGNTAQRISEKAAFNLLYPTLFPTFWDRKCLENVVSFSQSLTQTIPCFRLGFVNNERVIDFVRKV